MIIEGAHTATVKKVNVWPIANDEIKIVITFVTESGLEATWESLPERPKGLLATQDALKKIGFTGDTVKDLMNDNNYDKEKPHKIYVVHERYNTRDGAPKVKAKVITIDRDAPSESIPAEKLNMSLFKANSNKASSPHQVDNFVEKNYKPEFDDRYTTSDIPF